MSVEEPEVPLRERTYPLPRPAEGGSDPRFTLGLLVDVTAVLVDHGYPPLTAMDAVELQVALFRFLYRGRGEDTPRAAR